jgi:hypothetical protein
MVGEGHTYPRRPAIARGAEGCGAAVLRGGSEAPVEYGKR